MVQFAAIFLAMMVMMGTFAIIFFKTNGEVSRGHMFMFMIGFMCFSIAVEWVPAEISFSKDVKITFTSIVKEVKAEAKQVTDKANQEKEAAQKEVVYKEMQIKQKEIEAKIARTALAKEVTKKTPAIDISSMIQ